MGTTGLLLMSVEATVLPLGSVVVVWDVTSFFSTSTGLSSFVGEAQPATSATPASASKIFPEFFIIVSLLSTMNMAASAPAPRLLTRNQRPNGPQTGSRMSRPDSTSVDLNLPSAVVTIRTSRPPAFVA